MNKKQSIERRQKSPNESTDAATQHAEEAAKTKAEELRTVLQSKSEQGQSSLGSVPARELKKDRKRNR